MIKLFIVIYVCRLMGRLCGRFCFFMCSRHKYHTHLWHHAATLLMVVLSLGCKSNPVPNQASSASDAEIQTTARQQKWQLDDGSKQPSLTDKVVDWVRQSQDVSVMTHHAPKPIFGIMTMTAIYSTTMIIEQPRNGWSRDGMPMRNHC